MTLFAKIGRAVSTFRGPVHEAMQREDVKAAAHYWRQRFKDASLAGLWESDRKVTSLSRQFSERELDSFERKMAIEFARKVVSAPDNWLFQEHGAEVGDILVRVLFKMNLIDELHYIGSCRMRLLLGREVAYYDRSVLDSWVPIWSNPNFSRAVSVCVDPSGSTLT